jgi:hypothetical protein
MEMGVGWDEIMRGAQAGFGPFYNEWVVVVPAYSFLTSPFFFPLQPDHDRDRRAFERGVRAADARPARGVRVPPQAREQRKGE